MSELSVIAKITAVAGKEEELERAMRAAVAPTHEESGNVRFALLRATDDPSIIFVVERWASKEDHQQHFETAHVKELLDQTSALIQGTPEVRVVEPLPEGDPSKGWV